MSDKEAVVVASVGRAVRLGKLPVEKDPRNLPLARYLDDEVALPQVPANVDWSRKVAAWPMYANDTLGDCTCAAVGHMEEAWSANVGDPFVPPDQSVVDLYWATGKTDSGRSCLAILNYWKDTGFDAGHKLTAFAQIDQQNRQHVEFSCWAFGGVYIGVALPKSAQSQVREWTVTTGPDAAPGSWGGHCVNLVGFGASGPVCVTWGRLMPMSWEFFAAYCDEAYALISPDFLVAGRTTPNGFDLSQLEADAAALRRQGVPAQAATGEVFAKLQGVGNRLFADPRPTPDETSFQVDNTSGDYYDSPYYKLHQNELQPVPLPALTPSLLTLEEIVGAEVLGPIAASETIVFHAVGDTGAAKVDASQSAAQALGNEASVADAMARDVEQGGASAPAFFFHLGDVIYYFGETQYYYDQFYEPFRNYDRPIFAIPGNHDGEVLYGANPKEPLVPTLFGFLRNFCSSSAGPSPDAAGLVRSTMTQPGVYFTLDAPLVSIIGLYTNVLEGPGVISSQGGVYPLTDVQLEFLSSELERLKPARQAGERAVLLACHHPPVSVDSVHGGTTGLANDIDQACTNAGLWPDAVLSGHAHLYQRFTRAVAGREIPYIVAGSGGYAVTPPQAGLGQAPITIGEYTLAVDPIVEFGYLTVTVDMGAPRGALTIAFNAAPGSAGQDSVTVELATNTIVKLPPA